MGGALFEKKVEKALQCRMSRGYEIDKIPQIA